MVPWQLPFRQTLLLLAAGFLLCSGPLLAQLTPVDLEALRQEGLEKGWTFRVGPSQATDVPLERLCGATPPIQAAPLEAPAATPPPADRLVDIYSSWPLPSAFDWRQVVDPPRIRQQGACNSCWAHAAIAPAEFAILIRDGVLLDFSEQWLISCGQAGSCQLGGWHEWALDLFLPDVTVDLCSQSGLVLEEDAPYLASEGTCSCPYPRSYYLDGWGRIPSDVAAIKWHIYHYGPVATGVYAGAAFQAYRDGVFNACTQAPINHAVVLVGWDDTQGADGVWIVRNSWGSDWGEEGYMRIEYGCSQINNLSNFVDYRGGLTLPVDPSTPLICTKRLHDSAAGACETLTLHNPAPQVMQWRATSDRTWLKLTPSVGTLQPDESQAVQVCLTAQADLLPEDLYEAGIVLVDETNRLVEHRSVSLDVQPDSLLGHWTMDAMADGLIADSTANGHDLRVNGEAVLSDGRFRSAVLLSDPQSNLSCINDPALQPHRSITVAAWIHADDLSGPDPQFIVHNAFRLSSVERGYMLYVANGRINWWVKTEPGSTMDTAFVGRAAQAGRWTHVAGTYDGRQSDLYMDGERVASIAAEGDIQWGAAPYRGLSIGGAWDYITFTSFKGRIDDVRVYDYALSQTEIDRLVRGLDGDLDGDWRVGLADLLRLAECWLDSVSPGPEDANHDGRIDLIDLTVLSRFWGSRG